MGNKPTSLVDVVLACRHSIIDAGTCRCGCGMWGGNVYCALIGEPGDRAALCKMLKQQPCTDHAPWTGPESMIGMKN